MSQRAIWRGFASATGAKYGEPWPEPELPDGGAPVAPLEQSQKQARKIIPDFAANSISLTKAMKKKIRKFVRAKPDAETAICKGFTSLPVTSQDSALSRGRGKITFDYIKALNPDLKVVVRPGGHTDKPGLSIRRVRVTLK